MCMPGDNVEMDVELITPIAIEEGLRFAIREGGRTVGSGVVTDDQRVIFRFSKCPMPLASGAFFCPSARGRRAAGRACAGRKTYIQIVLSLLLGTFCPRGRQCTGPCLMPEGLWAAAAGRLGAAPAAGSGKGGQKCQRWRVVPLAVNSAGHWGGTGGRGNALAEGSSAGSGRRHGPRTAQAIGASSMGKTAPAAGNKACGAGLAHARNFWYTGSRTHAAGGTGQSCACAGTPRGAGRCSWRRRRGGGPAGGNALAARRRAHRQRRARRVETEASAQKGRAFARGLLLLVLAALALRLVPAALYHNAYDLESYNIPWAITAHENWLAMYEATLGLYPLDYPPLLPTLFGGCLAGPCSFRRRWAAPSPPTACWPWC